MPSGEKLLMNPLDDSAATSRASARKTVHNPGPLAQDTMSSWVPKGFNRMPLWTSLKSAIGLGQQRSMCNRSCPPPLRSQSAGALGISRQCAEPQQCPRYPSDWSRRSKPPRANESHQKMSRRTRGTQFGASSRPSNPNLRRDLNGTLGSCAWGAADELAIGRVDLKPLD